MKESKLKTFRIHTVALAIGCMSMSVNTQAGFMDDFYSAAGAAANVTPASVIQTQSGTFLTGGSVTWRVQQSNFDLFGWTPPSYKAGCGGIDLFGGSFSFPNSAQFVALLQQIGQNAAGLFFEMALQAMSPVLAQTIKGIQKDIQYMNGKMQDSCTAARDLTSGIGKQIAGSEWGKAAQAKLDGIGDTFSTYQAATKSLNDMWNINFPSATMENTGGGKMKATPEKNTLLVVLNSGNYSGWGPDDKNVIISLYGSRILRRDASTEILRANGKDGILKIHHLAGRWNQTAATIPMYNCGGISDPCYDMPRVDQTGFKTLAARAYESLKYIRDGIRTRTNYMASPTSQWNEAMRILGTTRLPAYRMLEIVSSPSYSALSEDLMQRYADFMGLELASNYVMTKIDEVDKAIMEGGKLAEGADVITDEDRKELTVRSNALKLEARDLMRQLNEVYGSQAEMIAQTQHLERSLSLGMSMSLMANLNSSTRK